MNLNFGCWTSFPSRDVWTIFVHRLAVFTFNGDWSLSRRTSCLMFGSSDSCFLFKITQHRNRNLIDNWLSFTISLESQNGFVDRGLKFQILMIARKVWRSWFGLHNSRCVSLLTCSSRFQFLFKCWHFVVTKWEFREIRCWLKFNIGSDSELPQKPINLFSSAASCDALRWNFSNFSTLLMMMH